MIREKKYSWFQAFIYAFLVLIVATGCEQTASIANIYQAELNDKDIAMSLTIQDDIAVTIEITQPGVPVDTITGTIKLDPDSDELLLTINDQGAVEIISFVHVNPGAGGPLLCMDCADRVIGNQNFPFPEKWIQK